MPKLCLNVRKATYERFLESMSPGPVYTLPTELGHSPVRLSSPKWSMHGGKRSSLTSPVKVPSPGTYEVPGSIGRQAMSTRRSSRACAARRGHGLHVADRG